MNKYCVKVKRRGFNYYTDYMEQYFIGYSLESKKISGFYSKLKSVILRISSESNSELKNVFSVRIYTNGLFYQALKWTFFI